MHPLIFHWSETMTVTMGLGGSGVTTGTNNNSMWTNTDTYEHVYRYTVGTGEVVRSQTGLKGLIH